MAERFSDDQEAILGVLNEAHDEGLICQTLPEICDKTGFSRPKVKDLFIKLKYESEIICEETHKGRYIYYIKGRMKIE